MEKVLEKRLFPRLHGKTKAGKIKIWEVQVFEMPDGTASFRMIHGLEDGAQTVTVRTVAVGKNLGKANQTSPFEQACAEAQSRLNKQIDSGYAEKIEDIKMGDDREFFLPMLAHRYDQHPAKMSWPAALQKKYDGFRLLARKEDGKVTLWSRKGKIMSVPKEIIADLEQILEEGQAFDGELYKHEWRSDSGDPDFQRIASAAKKYNSDTPSLEYHVYDVPDETRTFQERFLDFQFKETSRIRRADTYIVQSEAEAMDYYQQWISGEKPYEGAMLRNLGGFYLFDHRSYDLQKIKPLADAEYEIVGGEEATGADAGTVVFRCVTESGDEFSVRPIGSRELRRKYWENLSLYVGCWLVVEYNGLTNDGKPRFPRGKVIREEWDLPKEKSSIKKQKMKMINPFK